MRTMQTIQQEYNAGCTQLGQIRYQLEVLTIQAQTLIQKLSELNEEAAVLNQKAKDQHLDPETAHKMTDEQAKSEAPIPVEIVAARSATFTATDGEKAASVTVSDLV